MASLSSVSSQPCCEVHVSSFRDDSHSKSSSSLAPSSSPSTSAALELPSIYVTFKVLQLVNAFRRRVTRKHTAARQASKKAYVRTATTEDFCQDFERQAFDEIDRYLGRKTRRPSSKRSKVTVDPVREGCTVANGDDPKARSIDWLLRQLNNSISFGEHSISAVAQSNWLFLEEQSHLSIDRLNVKELCELLVVVKDILKSLQHPSRGKIICEGNEVVHGAIHETYSANLEHLLLRLESELVRLLVARLVELVHRHVKDCQKDQSKRAEEWFFEFPDARHPLSTTWPWSIKPSLAVLWGVCWMFYDRLTSAPTQFDLDIDTYCNLVDKNGRVIVPADQVQDFLLRQQQQQQEAIAMQRHSPLQQRHSAQASPNPRQASVAPPFPNSPSVKIEAQAPPPTASRLPQGLSNTSLSHPHNHLADQAAHATSGVVFSHTNNSPAFATQPPSAYAHAQTAWQVPEDTFPSSLGFPADNSAYSPHAAVAGSWNQGIPVSSYPAAPHAHAQPLLSQTRPGPVDFSGQEHLPQRSRHPSTPSIRVTTDFSQLYPPPQEPQDVNAYSATSISTNSSVPLQESTSYQNWQQQQFNQTHLSPHSPYMADVLPEGQVTTPPRSPHDLQLGELLTRKRSHSQMSAGGPNGGPYQPAEGSHSGSQVGDNEFPSPGRIEVHRPEPLMNENRKYMCNFGGEECEHLIFDRKCEWSKHMDKHDRPYRCPDPGCAKLQGFTYSGGLLRHEREVHGKHGGPKAQLRCPHEDCKRHTGKGFTRKENLNEHIRRVHQNREQPSQSTDPNLITHDHGFEALAGAARALDETTDTPASRVSEALMVEEDRQPPPVKRRRQMPAGPSDRSASEDVEDLRRQIEHLQQENEQKDRRLLELERMISEMDRRSQQQQAAQNQWNEQQAAAAAAQAIATAASQA